MHLKRSTPFVEATFKTCVSWLSRLFSLRLIFAKDAFDVPLHENEKRQDTQDKKVCKSR